MANRAYLPPKHPSRIRDIRGRVFRRLTVTEFLGISGKQTVWRCVCECGNISDVLKSNLIKDSPIKSCGCQQGNITHRSSYTQAYKAWCNLRQRCNNPKHNSYHRYGGRGISVHPRWLESFENFIEDMGHPEEGMSIERKNNDGNYEPGNCEWIPMPVQAKNRHNNIYFEFDGEKLSLREISARCGIPYDTTYGRLKRGLPMNEILKR